MSRPALVVVVAPLLLVLASCGAKPADAAGADVAALVRGSWSCSFSGKSLGKETISGTYSISYVSDGTWAASGTWKTRLDGRPVELGVVSRGTWAIADGKLEETSSYEAATWAKLAGKPYDHGDYNRAMAIYFHENPSLDPSKTTMVTTLSELSPQSMVGVDQNGNLATCRRPEH